MKINRFLQVFIFLFALTKISYSQNWNLVWSDEFNTNGSINEDKWFHQTQLPNGYSWYNNELIQTNRKFMFLMVL